MAGRALRIVSRIIFAICGVVTLLTAAPYAMLRGVDLPYQREWIFFVLVLGLAGLWSLSAAMLPRSWMAKATRNIPDDESLFARPLKLLVVMGALGYIVAVAANFAPHDWDLNPQLMLVLCPLYFVKMTFDPSPAQIFLLLAPMNVAVYGSMGLTLAHGWRTRRR